MTKRRNISNMIVLLLLFAYILIYRLCLMGDLLKYAEFITASVTLGIMSLSILLLGFRKSKTSMLKKNVKLTAITLLVLYFSISYTIGLVIGFLKNSYSLALPTMIENIFSPIIIIIGTEILRYVMIRANKDKKYIIVLTTILLTALEVATNVRTFALTDFDSTFRLVTLTILPIVSKNIVMSYLSYEVGYQVPLIYRLIMDIYIYILPVIPDLGEYVNSMVGICLPLILYLRSSKTISEYYEGVEVYVSKGGFGLLDGVSIAAIIVIASLMSGVFPYYMLGIGSASMSPFIEKGDLVIIEKINSDEDIVEGDVIAFDDGTRTIVHRLVEKQEKDGKIYYKTKGDANNSRDQIDLEIKDIKGKVNFKIPYIAYPSIFLTEALNKE